MKKNRWMAEVTMLLGLAFFAGCGDDDSFTPVSRDRDYDYVLSSTGEFEEYECNKAREGRVAVVGRDNDRFTCEYDESESVYIWAGESDTLTAEGDEFVRSEASSGGSSSSEESSSSSVAMSSSRVVFIAPETKEDFFNPDIDYGEMTDERDGKTYRTVTIGENVWMAENLNYADSSLNALLEGNSRCYDGDTSECELYGRLYNRAAAMDDTTCAFGNDCDLGDEVIRGVCPEGWHIPTKAETQEILDLAKKKAAPLRSSVGWYSYVEGVDELGLSLVGTGGYVEGTGYKSRGEYTYFWVIGSDAYQTYLLVRNEDDEAYINTYSDKELYYPVRCVKDE